MAVTVPETTIQDQTTCDAQCTAEQQLLEDRYKEQTKDLKTPEGGRQAQVLVTGTPIPPTETSKSNTSFVVGGIVLGFVLIVVALVVVMRRTSK